MILKGYTYPQFLFIEIKMDEIVSVFHPCIDYIVVTLKNDEKIKLDITRSDTIYIEEMFHFSK